MPTPRNIQGTLRADYLAYFRVYIFWLSTMPRRRADKHSRLLKTRIGWGFSVLRGRRPNYWIRSSQKLSLLFRKLRLGLRKKNRWDGSTVFHTFTLAGTASPPLAPPPSGPGSSRGLLSVAQASADCKPRHDPDELTP